MSNTGIKKEYKTFFSKTDNLAQATSPGRMDVMGGFGDYSGSLLLQKTIRESTTATVRLREDDMIRVRSLSFDLYRDGNICTIPVSLFYNNRDELKDYETVRKDILSVNGGHWAIYVIGCFYLLIRDYGITVTGADVLIESNIPLGKGVSSSAALEVSVLMALDPLYGLDLGKLELPIVAQKVENRVVGAPCGLMDQLTSYLGRSNTLLPIKCQPVDIFPVIEIPKGVHFTGIDSGVRHAVSGSSYVNVRTAAFMGYSLIAVHEGVSVADIQKARENEKWDDLPFSGYLANIDPAAFEERYLSLLPERMSGSEFTEKYGTVIDPVTLPRKDEYYAVRQCTAHPVFENKRVMEFRSCLETIDPKLPNEREDHLKTLGELMNQSHEGYSLCGLGNERTDELVAMVREKGVSGGVYGAKITGGGSGGAVCILCDGEEGLETARNIGKEYARKYDVPLVFFKGDTDGGFYRVSK